MLASVNSTLAVAASQVKLNLQPLSESASVSLLTCGSGDELYSAYGHSAIRVRDYRRGKDVVFNYGTFDFNTPFFYPKFMNGTLDYMLSVSTFSTFMFEYKYFGRKVEECDVLLSESEKQELWRRLVENSQDENKFYRYDFFYDNCATRIRDMLFLVKGVSAEEYEEQGSDSTYRMCIHKYVGPEEWASEGIDLLLGVRTEAKVSPWTRAFLPDDLVVLLRKADIVGEPRELLAARPPKAKKGGAAVWAWLCETALSPIGLSLIVLAVVCLLTLVERRRGKRMAALDFALWGAVSVLSLIMWYMWIVSEIRICSYNYNVLWASILYIPAIVLLARGNGEGCASVWLARVNVGLCVVYWLLGIMGIQYALPMGIILSLALTVRNIALISRNA